VATRTGQFVRFVDHVLNWQLERNQHLFVLDAFIGLPAVYSNGVDLQVENERNKFLVIELSPRVTILFNMKKQRAIVSI
jgi:hypothetical protein